MHGYVFERVSDDYAERHIQSDVGKPEIKRQPKIDYARDGETQKIGNFFDRREFRRQRDRYEKNFGYKPRQRADKQAFGKIIKLPRADEHYLNSFLSDGAPKVRYFTEFIVPDNFASPVCLENPAILRFSPETTTLPPPISENLISRSLNESTSAAPLKDIALRLSIVKT